jgi:hypothetical protein
MDVIREALLFWKIVEASLVEFYGWEPDAARVRVLEVRGRMTKAAIDQDISYHFEPLNIAGDLANVFGPSSDEMLQSYHALVRRVTAQCSVDAVAKKAKARKPRLTVSKPVRSVAALAR